MNHSDYVALGHNLYWNMLGNMRGVQNHTGKVSWLGGDVSCTYHVKFDGLVYEEEVAEIARSIKAGEIPARLIITPDSAPSNVDNICELFMAHEGFSVGTDSGMTKVLSAETIADKPPKNINIFKVSEIDRLKIAGAILNSAFEYDIFSFEHYLDAFYNPNVRFYLAEYNGIPAGACMSILGENFVEIAWVGTLTGYRKKGLAGYLVGMAEQTAFADGKTISVLTAFSGAVNAYSRIGYEKCCEYKVVCCER